MSEVHTYILKFVGITHRIQCIGEGVNHQYGKEFGIGYTMRYSTFKVPVEIYLTFWVLKIRNCSFSSRQIPRAGSGHFFSGPGLAIFFLARVGQSLFGRGPPILANFLA